MFPKKDTRLCVFYAVTPLAAGSGQAIGAVDLPIQRERHTQWPQVQASGVKGAFRDWFLRYYLNNGASCQDKEAQAEKLTERIFGKAESGEDGGGQAGAIAVTDARLLAFPVRVTPFVWVTCPGVLSRLRRDLQLTSLLETMKIPALAPKEVNGYIAVTGEVAEKVVLEDLAVSKERGPEKSEGLKEVFKKLELDGVLTRLLLVSDQNFSFLVRTTTEVQPQIRINFDTGTADEGSLRYQELLPADSVLYSLVFFAPERINNDSLTADVIRNCVQQAISTHLQMGGDLTLGRGLLEVTWLPKDQKGGAA